MEPRERDEMLIRIDERTRRMDKALFGNGQPGMQDRLNTLETVVAERTAPSKSAVMGLSGGTAVVLTLLAEWVKAKMGVQ